MRVIRRIACHVCLFLAYAWHHSTGWISTAVLAAVAALLVSIWLGDPAWVRDLAGWSCLFWFAANLCLIIRDYRRGIGDESRDRYEVHDRNDIWKGW